MILISFGFRYIESSQKDIHARHRTRSQRVQVCATGGQSYRRFNKKWSSENNREDGMHMAALF